MYYCHAAIIPESGKNQFVSQFLCYRFQPLHDHSLARCFQEADLDLSVLEKDMDLSTDTLLQKGKGKLKYRGTIFVRGEFTGCGDQVRLFMDREPGLSGS